MSKTYDESAYMTIKQAATKWTCSYSWVARMVQYGQIKNTIKINGWETLIPINAPMPKIVRKPQKK